MTIELATTEDIRRTEATLDERLARIESLLGGAGMYISRTKVVYIKDIAKVEGVSYAYMVDPKHRYMLPNFGVSDYPTGARRWDKDTYLKWARIPPRERKDMWDNMDRKDRAALVISTHNK